MSAVGVPDRGGGPRHRWPSGRAPRLLLSCINETERGERESVMVTRLAVAGRGGKGTK